MRIPIKQLKKRRKIAKILLALFLAVTLLVYVDGKVRPLLKNIAQSQAKKYAVLAINEAIGEVVSDESITYSSLVKVTSNTENQITSIDSDIIEMNRLKAKLSEKIAEKLSEVNERDIGIPIGSLTGSDILVGRGPKINIKLELYNNVVTQFRSTFDTAGINQTRHQIILDVKASMYVIIPGYNTATDVSTNFSIAETIIVGDVPDAFTSIDGKPSEIADILNDYAAVN